MRLPLIFVSLFLVACTEGNDPKKDVLPPQKMESVLWDILKAEAIADSRQLKDSSFQSIAIHTTLYDTVFAVHQIDKDVFKKSLRYYESRPDLLKIIFDSLQSKSDRRTLISQ